MPASANLQLGARGDCGGVSFSVSSEKSPARARMDGGLVVHTGPIAVSQAPLLSVSCKSDSAVVSVGLNQLELQTPTSMIEVNYLE